MKFAEQVPVPTSILDDLTALERIKAFYAVPGFRGAAAAVGLGLLNNTFNDTNSADQNLLMLGALGAGIGAYYGRKTHASAAGALRGMGATQRDNLRAGFDVPIKRAPTGRPDSDWKLAQNEFYNKAGGGAAGVYLRDLGSGNNAVMPGFQSGERKIAKPVEAPSTATTRGAQPTQVGETAIPTPTTRLALPPARSPIITPPPKSTAPTKLVEEVSNLGPSNRPAPPPAYKPRDKSKDVVWEIDRGNLPVPPQQLHTFPTFKPNPDQPNPSAPHKAIAPPNRFAAKVQPPSSIRGFFAQALEEERRANPGPAKTQYISDQERFAAAVRDVQASMAQPRTAPKAPTAQAAATGLAPTVIPKKANLGKNVELTMEDDPMPNEPAGEHGFVNEPVDPMAKPVQKRKRNSNLVATPIMGGARRHW